MRVRKKPVVVEAFQWFGDERQTEDPAWIVRALETGKARIIKGDEPHLAIATLEGTMTADPGDWIIKGVNGELYPCKPDIFEKTYEILEEDDNE